MKERRIKIRSSHDSEFNSEVPVGDETYLIQSEAGGARNPTIVTRVYLRGRVISSKEIDYRDMMNAPDLHEKVRVLMLKQHESAVRAISEEKLKAEKTPSDYIEEVRGLMKRGRKEDALVLVSNAREQHPDNPFLLSYYGYLDAVVNKKYKDGIAACNKAIAMLKKTVPFGEEFFFPILYLNLGKAHLASGNKKDAILALERGLAIDGENREIRRMLKELGIRRQPPISFMKRSHFLNKYLGKLLHHLGK
ncbi:MAG TPA: hypothetical protein VFG09_14860 [Thermodesulfovibrionales bacterium]|nr:hypothetical protein [Thermodesulfovibrionales bacterium]